MKLIFRTLYALALTLVLLAGCGSQETPAPPRPTQPPAQTRAPVPTWTPTRPATPAPTATPRPTRTAPPTASPTPAPLCPPVSQQPFDPSQPIRGLILFTSDVSAPFLPPQARAGTTQTRLWAIEVGGQQSGRLSTLEGGVYVHDGDAATTTITLLSDAPLPLESANLRQQILPAVCTPPADERPWWPCDGFRFSPGGHWAAFYWGEAECGRGIMALETRTGLTVTLAPAPLGLSFDFVAEDAALLRAGGCATETLSLIDLPTGAVTALGPVAQSWWNPQHTALAITTPPNERGISTLWGFDADAGRIFLPPPQGTVAQEQPLWSPQGTRLLFEHRPLSGDSPVTGTATLSQPLRLEPQQIRVVNVASGETRALLADADFDYHLCTATDICTWQGEWIEVRRLPHEGATLEAGAAPDLCARHGQQCGVAATRLALNGRTGEVLPWEERPTPPPTPTITPTPTPQPLGPDSNQAPLYREPDGRYTLYPGQDGHSLWCVPSTGDPIPWVTNGENFVYVP